MNINEKINQLMEQKEYAEIADIILDLPENMQSDEIMHKLADVYSCLGEYDLALEVLNDLPEKYKENSGWKWLYSVADALFHCGREESEAYYEACIGLNPPEDIISDCDEKLGELRKSSQFPEMYTEEEFEAVANHIEKYYGKFDNIFHEIFSPDIHVDVCIIPPNKDKNYYTLVTVGMGAHYMNVPADVYDCGRAELAICLPPYWKINSDDEKWYWPIRLLKNLARLPVNHNSWLGWGHSADNRTTFADNTALCGSILVDPQRIEEDGESCTLPNGEKVNFYFVIPIYKQEMNYKIKFGTKKLLKRMNNVSFVVNPDRDDVCADIDEDGVDLGSPLDIGLMFEDIIREKKLPVDIITAYNHMAIYLRWCIEHNFMSPGFLRKYPEPIQSVKNNDGKIDLREFIRDELDGVLTYSLFNDEGVEFAKFYYGAYTGGNESPFYPADIDEHANEYFGEKAHSDEFQNEEFLFVPYDENYYCGMKKYLDKRYREMKQKKC